MKAVRVVKAGPSDALEVAEDVPIPNRQPGELLVRQHGSSVNPLESNIFDMPRFIVKKPKILGGEVAGVVEEADPQSKFKKGDRVFGMGEFGLPWFRPGAFAEWVCIPEKHITGIPDSVSFEQAAAAPLVALTAWQALEKAELGLGKRALIHAGAGGVGHVAVQLAKDRGAHVTATCSASSATFVKGLGADEVIDYRTQRFEQVCKEQPFDVIMDTVGGDYNGRGMKVLMRKGFYSHVMNMGWTREYGMLLGLMREGWDGIKGSFWSMITGPRYQKTTTQPNGAHMQAIAGLMAAGRLKIAIDRIFPLQDTVLALRHLQEGHPQGKVVLQIAANWGDTSQ